MLAKARDQELEGFGLWLKTTDAAEFYQTSIQNEGWRLGPVCTLCVSDIHEAVPRGYRKPGPLKQPRSCTTFEKCASVFMDHIRGHHQHEAVKAMCLREMLNNIPWLSKFAIAIRYSGRPSVANIIKNRGQDLLNGRSTNGCSRRFAGERRIPTSETNRFFLNISSPLATLSIHVVARSSSRAILQDRLVLMNMEYVFVAFIVQPPALRCIKF